MKTKFWLRFTTTDTTNLGGGGAATQPPQPAGGQITPPSTPPPAPTAPAKPTDEGASEEDEPLRPAGMKALQAERDARKAAEDALADAQAKVREFEQAQMTEQERLAAQLKEAQETAAKAVAEATRLRIAAELNVPGDLHEFLTGDTEDEIRAKAQKLAALAPTTPGTRRPAPDPSQGATPQLNQTEALEEQLRELEKAGTYGPETLRLRRQLAAIKSKTPQP